MKKYLLFLFAKHEQQEKLIKIIAEEIKDITDNSDVNFFYGDESVIYSFDSSVNLKDLQSFFKLLLSTNGLVYFFFPFDSENTTYFLPLNAEKHILNTDKMSEFSDISSDDFAQAQKLFFSQLISDEEVNSNKFQFSKFEEDEEKLFDVKTNLEPISLDELLDKINEKGYNSLSKSEKKLLNHYSNKIK
jgi:hypothetical protein